MSGAQGRAGAEPLFRYIRATHIDGVVLSRCSQSVSRRISTVREHSHSLLLFTGTTISALLTTCIISIIMCKLVPVLRVIGFVFLVLAIVACLIAFVAPFWIRLPLDDGRTETTPSPTTPLPGGEQEANELAARADIEKQTTTQAGAGTTPSSGLIPNMGDTLSGLLKNGSYHGLWAKCFHNFSCSCFWQNDFAMEKEYPGTECLAWKPDIYSWTLFPLKKSPVCH